MWASTSNFFLLDFSWKARWWFQICETFNNLNQYVCLTSTATMSCDDILRCLLTFKYVIKTDFTKSVFQITLAKISVPYLATITPLMGLRVYLRSATGIPVLLKFLQKLTLRVFGDFITEYFLAITADDLFVSGKSEGEILRNYERVLHCITENNFFLSARKPVICPRTTAILEWHRWLGTLRQANISCLL